MKGWFWPIVALMIAVLAVFWWGRNQPSAVKPAPPEVRPRQIAASTPDPAREPQPSPAAAEPEAEPVPFDTVTKTAIPERVVVQRLHHRIREFGHRFGGNPVGTNAEITAALNGGNGKGVRFLDPADVRLNADGELLDPWQTPYFFHQLSASEMEVRSAGPDGEMWTPDDVLVK